MTSEQTDKHCTGCDTTKPVAAFSRNKVMRDGRANWCKACLQKLQGRPEYRARRMEKRRRNPIHALWIEARSRAGKAGITFDLKEADLVLPERCPVLDIPLTVGEAYMSDNSPTLDRIDPRHGYVSGNVVVISWLANRLKSNCHDPAIFERIAHYMRNVRIVYWQSDDHSHGLPAEAIAVINPRQHEALERVGLSSSVREDGSSGQ